MIRGYATGLGAGTQVLTHLPWILILGTPGEFPRALLMGAGWVINLAVAEWIIRKRFAHPTRTSPVAVKETWVYRSFPFNVSVQTEKGARK